MTEPQSAVPARSPWWLAVRVVDEPGAVFRALAAKPRALVPLLMLVVAMAVYAFGTPATTLRRQAERQAALMAERAPDRFTEEDRAQMVAQAASPTRRATILLAGAVSATVVLAIIAGILLLIFGAVGTEPLKYKDEFAIVTHAWVPQFLGTFVMVALWRFAGMEEVQLSLGFLVNEDAKFLHGFLSLFSLFGAWTAGLLALGNQIRTKMKGMGTALAVVGGLWVLANAGLAALGSVFGGFGG